MGGNAIKKVQVVRLKKSEYERVKEDVMKKLRDANVSCALLREVPNKSSFGDLDVLYSPTPALNIREVLVELFDPKEIVVLGPVMSFAYSLTSNVYFQVDLIKCENMEAAEFYFSYGDVGAILGAIVNHHNIKLGEVGLFINVDMTCVAQEMPIEHATKVQHKLVLSSSPVAICEYLGLNFDAWVAGFEAPEDIFDWILTSPWFTPDCFQVLNNRHGRRALKRPFYIGFLQYYQRLSGLLSECADGHEVFGEKLSEYCATEGEGASAAASNFAVDELGPTYSRGHMLKGECRQAHAVAFFNKGDEISELMHKYELKEQRKTKFNGLKFMKHGVAGGVLVGKAMNLFKLHVLKSCHEWDPCIHDFEDWLDRNPAASIDLWIQEFVASFMECISSSPGSATERNEREH